jgi:hypothetical protein
MNSEMNNLKYISWSADEFHNTYSTHITSLLSEQEALLEYTEDYICCMTCSSRYVIPPKVIEFLNTSALVKRNANILHVGIRVLKNIEPHFLDLIGWICANSGISNFLDWVLFMTEYRGLILAYYYVNCNPDSPCYGNIMILKCNGSSAMEGFIRRRSIDKLFADLLDWFSHCESDPIDNVSAAMLFLDTKCPSHWGSANLRPGITNREVLTFLPHTDDQRDIINYIHNTMTSLLMVSHCNDITTSSFTSYIFR